MEGEFFCCARVVAAYQQNVVGWGWSRPFLLFFEASISSFLLQGQ